ncbi:MAG: NADH-quinone oxidoreductase subunit M [Bacteriovoracaceae bacterium]
MFNVLGEDFYTVKDLAEVSFPAFFNLKYAIALDGLAGILILLNALLVIVVVIATYDLDSNKYRLYYFTIYALTWTVNGALLSKNLYFFYMFWEAMLIPLFLLIGIFGSDNRKFASFKFFLFTATGSLLLLTALIYLSTIQFKISGSYDLTADSIKAMQLPFNGFFSPQALVFWAFCIAFFIKVPVFPFHSWLPDAHVEAPTAGSIILAGILLKLGIYALLRFVIPVFPEAVTAYQDCIIILGLAGIVYGALTAISQSNIKKLCFLFNKSHGLYCSWNFYLKRKSNSGAIFQMVSHGLTTGGLSVVIHYLYIRRHTKEIAAYGGVAKVMPVFAVAFFMVLIGSMGVPLTNGFVGEYLITFGIYEKNMWYGIIAAFGVVLTPLYLVNLYYKTMLGPITDDHNKELTDINWVESTPFIILVVFIFYYGVYPLGLMKYFDVLAKFLMKA